MRWTVHGEREIYHSDWLALALADIELPDGTRFDHHVIRMPAMASGTVIADPDRGVLLLWRHRFVTDTWGWEVPAGRIDPGESPEDAARREALEETGWEPGPLTHLTSYFPHNGTSDLTFHLFSAAGATKRGEPTDPHESERVEWVSWERVRRAIRDGEVHDGLSLTALVWVLAFGAND